MDRKSLYWALNQNTGNATGKAILLVCACYADEQGELIIERQRLVDEVCCHINTVSYWLRNLEERGFLRSRLVVEGRGRALVITLKMDGVA